MTAPRLVLVVVLVGLEGAPAAAWTGVTLPTLSFWGKVVLAASLIAVGMIAMRRSSRGKGQEPGGTTLVLRDRDRVRCWTLRTAKEGHFRATDGSVSG